MHGLLNIDKPASVSSRHVVSQVERALSPLAVGHAGTLDPLATGVLVVAVGRATKLVDYLHRYSKSYIGTFLLGRSSDTEDATGTVELIQDPPRPSLTQVQDVIPQFVGEILQRPPAFSALKVDGKRAYKLARKGKAVELEPRPVVIHRIQLLRYDYPELLLEIECGSGTYIRSLGRDLASAMGTEAVMSELRRTRIGPFELTDAYVPDDVCQSNLPAMLQPSLLAVGDMTRVHLSARQADQLAKSGVLFDLPPPISGGDTELAGLAPDGRLFAILMPSKGDRWKVKTLLG